VTRGDVYRARLAPRSGHVQHGSRYAVIVQATELLGFSTVLVAPTSRGAQPAAFRPEVELAGERTRVMVEQLRALDVQRLGEFAGRLSATEMRDVDEALALILALR
jgi:mRNA interferase MazF